MGLTFTKAPEVTPEQPITSAQYRKLALAFNDRLRSGVGDPTFRIQQYWFNLFRQVRNPAEGGLVFPAQGEFFELYQLLDPEQSQATWPVTGPGEYEGANLGNPMMQFVFGNPVMEREDQMLGEPYFYFRADTLEPQTPYDWWVVGKVQRGTIDIVQNKTCMPALVGAQRALSITSFQYSPHGRSYGGFFPTPIQLLPNCGTTEATGHGIPSYQLKFSALRADVNTTGLHGSVGSVDGKPVVTYAGTCPPDADYFGAGHVAAFGKFPYAYYLLVWDGSQFHVVRLPTSDWIEGPYDSKERLSRPEGGQLLRALNAFAADFRGSDQQRAEPDFVIEDLAFPFQEFFTTQYYLAPNFGITVADTGNCLGDTAPFCPVVLFTGQTQWPAGTVGKFWHDRSSAYTYHEGFVLGGMIAVAEYLAEPVTLEILDGTKLIALLQLTPEEPQMMRWLRDCPTPKLLRVRLISELKLTNAAGGLFVEFTEQLRMLPEIWDAYFVLRTSATGGGDAYGVGVDGRGKDRENSRQLGDNYFQFGCVMNPQASSLRDIAEWVNDNPVYDAARRLSREHMRILSRRQFLTYEVTGGKSILRFKRYAYGMNHSRADCFYGIAPPYDPIPSGQLLAARRISSGARAPSNMITARFILGNASRLPPRASIRRMAARRCMSMTASVITRRRAE